MMKIAVKLICILSIVGFLSGCVNTGPQASFADRMDDSLGFTSASNVPASQVECVSLTKAFSFKSGSVSYTLPAGNYKGIMKDSDGYFYYAPSSISKSSMWVTAPKGIYINNQFTKGYLFNPSAQGFSDRPIRDTVLPESIFSVLTKRQPC